MRIIAGEYKGRVLRTADSPGLRPAMGKTRGALFSILESRGLDWSGAHVLDLFAGCGSLGLECLSRGAAEAVFVDNGAPAARCLSANISSLGAGHRATVHKADAGSFLRSPLHDRFDVVFIDPPYRKGLAQAALARLVSNRWLNPGAFVIAELEKDLEMEPVPGLTRDTARAYGQTVLEIWRNDEDSALPGNL